MHNHTTVISKKEKRIYAIFFLVLVILWVFSTIYTKFSFFELFANCGTCWDFLSKDFFPPSLPGQGRLLHVVQSVLITIAMAVTATVCAGVCAFFVSLFASEYISPIPRLAKYIRGIATFMRNIPALVWAFILFSSLGIGTSVGFAALFITSFAFLIRAFVETMDEVSDDCVESLLSVGASFPQRVVHGILPSCIPGFISWFLYCFEVNIRASTIVGMVGGGGVGLVLLSYLKSFKYHTASGIILLVAVMIILVDLLTGKLRRELEK